MSINKALFGLGTEIKAYVCMPVQTALTLQGCTLKQDYRYGQCA